MAEASSHLTGRQKRKLLHSRERRKNLRSGLKARFFAKGQNSERRIIKLSRYSERKVTIMTLWKPQIV